MRGLVRQPPEPSALGMRPDGIEQVGDGGKPRPGAVIMLWHDAQTPAGQGGKRGFRDGVIKQRLVEGRAENKGGAAADRLGGNGKGKAIRDALGQFVQGVEAAGREQHNAARRLRPDGKVEIGFNHPRAVHRRQLAIGNDPLGVGRGDGENRAETEPKQAA